MRRLSQSISFVWILLLGAGTAVAAEDGYDLFQQALLQERVEGDLSAAIEHYSRIVENHGANRQLSAAALVQIGQCWEKLGSAEASGAYERVLRDYADQHEQVTTARSRLAMLAMQRDTGMPRTMVTRRILTGADYPDLGSLGRDGRYIAFVDWSTGDLALRELATGAVRRLTDKGPWDESPQYALNSAVSADGRRVVFTWSNEQDDYELRTVRTDGSQQEILYANKEVPYPTPFQWSPDGSQILALFTRRDRTNQIVLVSTSDGSVRVVKTLDWRYPFGMSFSPDGRFITYAFPRNESAEDYDIFALATNGDREHILVQHPAHDGWPIWTPDGKHVLFTSNRTGTMGVWEIAVVDGKPVGSPKLVKSDMGRNQPLGVTAAGSYYYGTRGGMKDVYTAEIDVATGELLSPPAKAVDRFTGSNSLPAWSPDGQYLAYASARSDIGSVPGAAELFIAVRKLETGEERELSLDLSLTAYPHLRWSPDGGSLLVTAVDEENRLGIYGIDVQTGDIRVIVQRGQRPDLYFGAVWASDGRSVFYTYKDVIYRRELEFGVVTKIREQVYAPLLAVSPDGAQIAYVGGDIGDRWLEGEGISLNIIPAGGGKVRVLLTEPQNTIGYGVWGDLAWTPDGRNLLFTKISDVESANKDAKNPTQSKVELWRVSATGGEAQRTDLAMVGMLNFQLHPDGRRIAFTVEAGGGELWVMENFLAGLSASQ